MIAFLSGSLVSVAALLASIIAILCFAAFLHWRRDRDSLVPYMFYAVLLSAAVSTLLSGRDFFSPASDVASGIAKSTLAVGVDRATALFLILAPLERIIHYYLKPRRQPTAHMLLLVAFGLYYLTNIISSAMLGAHPTFGHQFFYPLLVGYAAFLSGEKDGNQAVLAARNALFIFLMLSALVAVVRPGLVLTNEYAASLIPGLTIRYAGLSAQPNTLGALVVPFALCLWTKPFRGKWINYFAWLLAGLSLLLSQSKTNWIAFVFCMGCVAYFRYGNVFNKHLFDMRRPQLAAALIVMLMFGVTLVAGLFMFGGIGDQLQSFFASKTGNDLLSLTGRTQIWEIAIREWHNHPVFGYGLTLWDEAYRLKIGLPAAYHAHNQFYQSLSSAGIVGVIGLLIYVAVLLKFVLKTARASQGLSLALFIFLADRSISEVPFSLAGLSVEQLAHMLLLMIVSSSIAGYVNSRQARPLSFMATLNRGHA